jgi:hypothetical protein
MQLAGTYLFRNEASLKKLLQQLLFNQAAFLSIKLSRKWVRFWEVLSRPHLPPATVAGMFPFKSAVKQVKRLSPHRPKRRQHRVGVIWHRKPLHRHKQHRQLRVGVI